MDPKIWGRGAWAIIFCRIYYFLRIMNEENYEYEIEKLKKTLYLICSNLPCYTCSQHSKDNIYKNSIMSEMNINRILHFFIELYNIFHEKDPIDISKITLCETFNH